LLLFSWMQSYKTSPGAPIPVNKGSQVSSLSSPLTSSVAGFGLRATKNGTPSTTDEELVRQTALSFFPNQQHEHLICSIDNASSSAAGCESAFISVTPIAGKNDGLGFEAEVPAASASAAPCAGSTAAVALPADIAFPSVTLLRRSQQNASMLDTARFFVVTITVIPKHTYNGGHD
jgi:hypothetical protein